MDRTLRGVACFYVVCWFAEFLYSKQCIDGTRNALPYMCGQSTPQMWGVVCVITAQGAKAAHKCAEFGAVLRRMEDKAAPWEGRQRYTRMRL
jgi:hypothetical protein